ncbi:MAG TPA: type II toxin-antitoxin system RelE/ParE family toxin [Verrucomicrobiae bacterium]|jgi:plasmid stabilization system protein ParE
MWYDKREPGVSVRLNVAMRELLHTLAQQPERFPHATTQTYKAKVPSPWPYSAFFTINIEHSEVKVLAIWHGARNPAELRRRLK